MYTLSFSVFLFLTHKYKIALTIFLFLFCFVYIVGLVQDCGNSIATTLELLQPNIKP